MIIKLNFNFTMQILLVHNWNCIRCFGNMFDVNWKQVILGTRIWSFSYWHLRSFRSCVYSTAPLWCASGSHSWRAPSVSWHHSGRTCECICHASSRVRSFQMEPKHTRSTRICRMMGCRRQGRGAPGRCPADLPAAGIPSWGHEWP